MNPPRPSVFVLMSNLEFEALSTERKIAYLAAAADSLKSGKAMATPNGEFADEDSLD
jgi:hypothetical protein